MLFVAAVFRNCCRNQQRASVTQKRVHSLSQNYDDTSSLHVVFESYTFRSSRLTELKM